MLGPWPRHRSILYASNELKTKKQKTKEWISDVEDHIQQVYPDQYTTNVNISHQPPTLRPNSSKDFAFGSLEDDY